MLMGQKKAKRAHSHKTENYFYLKEENGERKVPRLDVYEIRRSYRQNKSNPNSTHIVAQVKNSFKKEYHPFYLVTYKNTAAAARLTDSEAEENSDDPISFLSP